MIGIKKIAPGRMGNRLFHYNFLRQIAKQTGIDYFCTDFPESKLFEDIAVSRKRTKLFRTSKYTSKEILQYTPDEFLKLVKDENAKGRDIVFNPPMLGEIFFDYLFFDPNEFIRVKSDFRKDFKMNVQGKKVIALHFRGTDFEAWNKNASLKFDYYKSSIDFCAEQFHSEEIVFGLYTDDIHFPAYTESISYLKQQGKKYFIGNLDEPAIVDFYQMSQSDVLVSSPSTFAIFAGVLGKQKKIIHSKAWIDYATGRNDAFWVKLASCQSPYYSLWKTL